MNTSQRLDATFAALVWITIRIRPVRGARRFPKRAPTFTSVSRANGTVIDTLQLPAGFFLNFQSARVGTPANPLAITFGGGGAVVLDPGN